MSSTLSLLFLGTGTSTGVPLVGCTCPVCQSKDPLNNRLRSSILLRSETTTLLIDSGPDLRQQALRHGITSIDAVIYTHGHLDHVSGFDDMRAFGWNSDERLPLYAGPVTLSMLEHMYGWAFSPSNTRRGYVRPEPHDHKGNPFTIGDFLITPVPVIHAQTETWGYIFEWRGIRIGYACDVKEIPLSSQTLLKGLDVLILDALRIKGHPTHLTVEESLKLMQNLSPKRGLFTHMGHEIDYQSLRADLPHHLMPAYDGLMLHFCFPSNPKPFASAD